MTSAARGSGESITRWVVALTGLTVVALALGTLPWPQREWVPGRVQSMVGRLLDQPPAVWMLIVGVAAVTIGIAVMLFRRSSDPAPPRWLRWAVAVLLVVTAAVGSLNALFFAGTAGPSVGPIIPVAHWMFTFVPSLLVGWLGALTAGRHGVAAALAAAVVAVPMQALSWSLLVRFDERSFAVVHALWPVALLVVAPSLIALAIVRRTESGRADDTPRPAPG